MYAKWSLLITLLTLSNLLYASNKTVCNIFPGVLLCGKGSIANLPEGNYGAVSLNGTTVLSKVNNLVAGSINGKSTVFKEQVTFEAGYIQFSNSSFNGVVDLTAGKDKFSYTNFNSDLNLNAEDSSFIASKINGNLTILYTDKGKSPSLILTKQSKITGNVIFSGNPGHVCCDNSSAINGKIINGDKQC
ncbi:MAG: hypothetical protein KIT27_08230 [Legionellales bacterium]|nr:hypothetical protein [Legionellales bacterium]